MRVTAVRRGGVPPSDARRAGAPESGGTCDPLKAVRRPVDELLQAFLVDRARELDALDPGVHGLTDQILRLTAGGGKRLRPAFVYWGARVAGMTEPRGAVTVGAAVELVHTFALLHDDVMDRSATRRGQPTAHRDLAAAHVRENRRGDAGWFGVSGAVLAGDLAMTWSDELLETAPVAPERMPEVRHRLQRLRAEVIAGQYLELRLAGDPRPSGDDPLRVALLKSARYTVTRPLQLGAATEGPGGSWSRPLATYGDATGIAFQLRDDVLGLFGDPARTEKSASDDLREGRWTSLLAGAYDRATSAGGRWLLERLGDRELADEQVEAVRDFVRETGALELVEERLRDHVERARFAVEDLPAELRPALLRLLELAVHRDR